MFSKSYGLTKFIFVYIIGGLMKTLR